MRDDLSARLDIIVAVQRDCEVYKAYRDFKIIRAYRDYK